jgi:pyruvate,orthophosphate dikinase
MTRVVDFDRPPEGLARTDLPKLLGGKAANLTVMAVDLGLPVPPAFTLTTGVCREYLASGWPAGLDDEIRDHMARLEGLVGRKFGDPSDPLLVSVRSGAPVSMPGMMDTILNVGLNSETAAAFAPEMAGRLRSRLQESLAEVGVDPVPEDPWHQVRESIAAVFRSWNSPRAIAYREHEGISAEMGTAATVQAMVFGNRNERSATGVLFTRNPSTGENKLYGDILFNAQGEDVVRGARATEDIGVLHKRLPDAARQLHEYARRLEHHFADMCDIEFTIEDAKLWLLQVRVGKRSPQAALRIAVEMADDPNFPLTHEEAVRRVLPLLADPPRVISAPRDAGEPLTRGLGASPGVAAGEIVTSPEAAVTAAAQGRAVILVRAETSPDDVHGMSVAGGILTATGGLASHAAVVARGWGIPAVVGASAVSVGPEAISVNGLTLKVGDPITVDGSTGEVFAGAFAAASEVVPEAATLIDWALELGIPIDRIESPAAPPAQLRGPATSADALRMLLVKGYATPEQASDCLLVSADDARALLSALEGSADAEQAVGAYRLTDAGKIRARSDLDADRAAWPEAGATLDAFVFYDKQVKDVVTEWQMRGEVVNDHSEPLYDALVLNGLASLHERIGKWLPTRFPRYRARLDRAAAAITTGDTRFVASPRVDSYHSVWFEFHEELILLAGRTRADEVAAGRA